MKIRKGKNIYFKLSVLKQGSSPEDFSGASDIKVTILEAGTGRIYVPLFEIDSNILSFEFPGSKNKDPGTYGIYLSYTKPNPDSVTGIEPFFLDKPNVFTVVSLTGQEDLKQAVTESLDMITLSISGAVNAPRDGIDGTTPHIGLNRNWYIGDEDTGVPTRGPAFTYDDFTAEEIEGLQRPATEAAQSAKDAVAILNGIVTEQNRKIASLEGLVMSLFNQLALKHYDRVVADGGTIFASYRELSDWFGRQGITQANMDGTAEFQIIRIDPYYTGVKIDPSSTSVRYINKAYNVCEKWDMQAMEAVELTPDYWFRCVKEKANQGLRTARLGMFFHRVLFSCKCIVEEVAVRQCPNGTDWEDRVGVAGIDAMAIYARYTLIYNNDRVGSIYPCLAFRHQDGLSEFTSQEYSSYPDDTEKNCKIFDDNYSQMAAEINIKYAVPTFFDMSDEFFETPVISDNGFKIFTSAAALGGNSGQGTVRVKDVRFRFKEYIVPSKNE